MNFKEFLLSEADDTMWANVPQHNDPEVFSMSAQELYDKQSPSNKKIMEVQKVQDKNYLNTLEKSVAVGGIKQPIQIHRKDSQIYDGLHRLIIALRTGIAEVPVKYLRDR